MASYDTGEAASGEAPREALVTDYGKGSCCVGSGRRCVIAGSRGIDRYVSTNQSLSLAHTTRFRPAYRCSSLEQHSTSRPLSEIHELLFCYREPAGRIEGEFYDVEPGKPDFDRPRMQHKVSHNGADQMRLLWFIARRVWKIGFALGDPRRAGEPRPAPFDRPPMWK